jgi:hypothetical protein
VRLPPPQKLAKGKKPTKKKPRSDSVGLVCVYAVVLQQHFILFFAN